MSKGWWGWFGTKRRRRASHSALLPYGKMNNGLFRAQFVERFEGGHRVTQEFVQRAECAVMQMFK